MQDRIKMNGTVIWQPDKGLGYDTETTYTEDSSRLYNGRANITPLFTVEQLQYDASNIPQAEATRILQIIDSGRTFTLHYFSLHYGRWMDAPFYVGKGSCRIGSLVENNEKLQSLSFNMTGVNPL